MGKQFVITIVLSVFLSAGNSLAMPRYDIIEVFDLGTFGGDRSFAKGINDSGQVAGYAKTAAGHYHAFIWDKSNGMTDLGTLGTGVSNALAINEAGQVAGHIGANALIWHAFLWDSNNGMVDLGTLGGDSSSAWGINNSGQIAGDARTSSGSAHACRWNSNGSITDLGHGSAYGINNSGQVVGGGTDGPVLWNSNNSKIYLGTLGGESGEALAINNISQVVGCAETAGEGFKAFLWDSENGMINLGSLGGGWSAAYGINDAGQVVGGEFLGGHCFLWDNVNGMVALNDLLPPDSNWTDLIEGSGINNRGQIVGYGEIYGEWHGFVLTPIYMDDGDFQENDLSQNWDVAGSGTVDTIESEPNNFSAQFIAGSPVTLSQTVETPMTKYKITFNYKFIDTNSTCTLTVFLEDIKLKTIYAPETPSGEFASCALLVTQETLVNQENINLAFTFEGPAETQLLLDNVEITQAPNARFISFIDFATIADHWCQTGCNESNNWCGGADTTKDGQVDMGDLHNFNWLDIVE